MIGSLMTLKGRSRIFKILRVFKIGTHIFGLIAGATKKIEKEDSRIRRLGGL